MCIRDRHKTLRGYASLTDEQADAITDPEAFSIKLYGKPYGDFELSSLRGKIKDVYKRQAHSIPRGGIGCTRFQCGCAP